jgi:hypothetical protein
MKVLEDVEVLRERVSEGIRNSEDALHALSMNTTRTHEEECERGLRRLTPLIKRAVLSALIGEIDNLRMKGADISQYEKLYEAVKRECKKFAI